MAFTTIDDPSKFFQTVLYTGNGSSQSITFGGNSDMQPDMLWTKSRGDNSDPIIRDTSRGISERLLVHASDAAGGATGTTAFNSDGFSLDSTDTVNANSQTFVAWGWKANGGTSNASAAESGSNVAYNFQVNTTSKFMINIYTGIGSNSTLNLGNQFTPAWMIFKNRSQADDWVVYHHKNTSNPHTDHLHLNTNAATVDDEQMFSDVVFAADEINVGTNHEVNADAENYVAYAWAEVQGFSKFGSFIGNGSTNGPFVYTGFKPAFLIIKRTASAGNWLMYDSKRDTDNEAVSYVLANANDAESAAGTGVDLLSNGFKLRNSGGNFNHSDNTVLYMAFAEQPFVSSKGVPATAR